MTLHVIQGLRVRTDCVCPPIPVRDFDWMAALDDYYDGAPDTGYGPCSLIGAGATEERAIDDLLEQVDALHEEAA